MDSDSAARSTEQPQSRRKRVLHVVHDMGVGGAEQMVSELAQGVDAERFESCVACIDGKVGPIGQTLRDNGIDVFELSRRPGFDQKLVVALRRLYRDQGIDVVHCHQYTPYTYGALASVSTGVRTIFTEHGRFHPDRYSWKRRLVNQVLMRLTDEIVAISAATRDALVKYEWFPRHAIRLVYNGVSPPQRHPSARPVRERYGIDPDAFVFGTIARLDPIKNQYMMLDALASVRTHFPECVLLFAGDGPERAGLENHATRLGLDGSVVFAGFITEIADYLDAIDIFLLTSWSEGTSVTLLEAMSLGKVIVVTRVGGNVEILDDEKTALFVDAGDDEALVRCLERLIEDTALRHRLESAAKENFKSRFDTQHMVSAYEALYEHA